MNGATAAATAAATPAATTVAGTDAWAVLQQLLCGQAAAAEGLANALRVDAYGLTTFGRTDALDLFARCPLAISSDAQVLVSPQAIAVIDDMADGRSVAAFVDLVDGVVARLWVVAATEKGATAEPAVAVARDDFMSQLRQHCQGDPTDHPGLQAGAWPGIVELGLATLGALVALPMPPAASSSQVWVMRAFSRGPSVAALYWMRVHATTLPRTAHHRLALAVNHPFEDGGHRQAAPAHRRLALSDPWSEPAPVSF